MENNIITPVYIPPSFIKSYFCSISFDIFEKK